MATFPHCDSNVLHAPGECEYCDEYPVFQEMRLLGKVNFTGHNDPTKLPCPATVFRPVETINKWPGNTPEGYTSGA
jgi:hypothetical protein